MFHPPKTQDVAVAPYGLSTPPTAPLSPRPRVGAHGLLHRMPGGDLPDRRRRSIPLQCAREGPGVFRQSHCPRFELSCLHFQRQRKIVDHGCSYLRDRLRRNAMSSNIHEPDIVAGLLDFTNRTGSRDIDERNSSHSVDKTLTVQLIPNIRWNFQLQMCRDGGKDVNDGR